MCGSLRSEEGLAADLLVAQRREISMSASLATLASDGMKEEIAMLIWETPDLHEVLVNGECTAYAGVLE
jgi:hypothetical protein